MVWKTRLWKCRKWEWEFILLKKYTISNLLIASGSSTDSGSSYCTVVDLRPCSYLLLIWKDFLCNEKISWMPKIFYKNRKLHVFTSSGSSIVGSSIFLKETNIFFAEGSRKKGWLAEMIIMWFERKKKKKTKKKRME